MGFEMPEVPEGSGKHPILLVVISANNLAASTVFYSKLFGWQTLATMPQYMAFDPGAGVAGIFQSHTPAMPAVAYIYAADVGSKLAEIEAAGGQRMGEPMRIPGTGCFGYFKDPSGTSMGLIGT